MLRDAVKEVRYHPGRFVATLLAIAISIGFMAAVSIWVASQASAMGKELSLVTSKADVVAKVMAPKEGVTTQQITNRIAAVDGVAVAEPVAYSYAPLSSEASSQYPTVYLLPSEQFRWAKVTDGAWPARQGEVALAGDLARKLQVGIGDHLDAGGMDLTVSGLTDDAANMFFSTAYLAPMPPAAQQAAGVNADTWLVRTEPGADRDAVSAAVRQALRDQVTAPDGEAFDGSQNLTVDTAEAVQAASVKSLMGDFDAMKYLLWIFSGIAALVGIIIIANTFTILLAQRRRQIGLMRAVGATGGQVRRRMLTESVVLGLIGSLLGIALGAGVAAIGLWAMKSLRWGLVLPARDLVLEVLLGVLLTVIAAVAPAHKATRVLPLEALQPVATSEQARKASIVRIVVCGLVTLAGVALIVMSFTAPTDQGAARGPAVLAIAGSLLTALGVLFGAPLYIPQLLKLMGAALSPFGPTPRLAAVNAVRNPRRAAATATALMLACGLIVTLQVGTATARRTATAEIEQRYPIDLTAVPMGGSGNRPGATPGSPQATGQRLTEENLAVLRGLPNVARQVVLTGGPVTTDDATRVHVERVAAPGQQAREFSRQVPASIGDGDILLGGVKAGTKVTLVGTTGKVTLTAVPTTLVDNGVGLVSEATLARLVERPTPQVWWGTMDDRGQIGTVMTRAQSLFTAANPVSVDGAAMQVYMIDQVVKYLLLTTTALLGAAVLISLIGVANTLGLSVIERTRESALLRALGMDRRSLRLMLLVEALMLGLVGVLVGIVAGGFFGWLGVRAVLRQAGVDSAVQMGVDLPMTLGLVAVAMVAAALASVLPGRRAASATPTEALAAE